MRAATFYGNKASGGGGGMYLYVDQGTPQVDLTDLILWNDQPDEYGFSSGSGAATPVVRFSEVDGGTAEPWFGSGSIDLDPLFVDADGGDLRLSWDNFPTADATMSPCIDTGDPASPSDPDGSTADMGALPFDQFGLIFRDGFESGDRTRWSAIIP